MARKRMISPEYCVDEVLADLPETDGHLFILSWMHADDEGRMVDSARVLRGLCFPLREDITVPQVAERIDRLVKGRFYIRYEIAGQHYLQIRNWKKHQNINRPTPSRIPPCPATLLSESSVSPQGQYRVVEEKLEESSIVEEKTPPTPTPPPAAAAKTFEELDLEEFKAKFPTLDLPWELGRCAEWWAKSKRKLKSPRIAFGNWCRNAIAKNPGNNGSSPTGQAAMDDKEAIKARYLGGRYGKLIES